MHSFEWFNAKIISQFVEKKSTARMLIADRMNISINRRLNRWCIDSLITSSNTHITRIWWVCRVDCSDALTHIVKLHRSSSHIILKIIIHIVHMVHSNRTYCNEFCVCVFVIYRLKLKILRWDWQLISKFNFKLKKLKFMWKILYKKINQNGQNVPNFTMLNNNTDECFFRYSVKSKMRSINNYKNAPCRSNLRIY